MKSAERGPYRGTQYAGDDACALCLSLYAAALINEWPAPRVFVARATIRGTRVCIGHTASRLPWTGEPTLEALSRGLPLPTGLGGYDVEWERP